KSENVHDGHRERMRKRFRETGSFEGYSDHEIIEMLLFYTHTSRNTNDIAHELMERFGSIAGILEANYDDLTKVNYITENAAMLFKMIPKFLPIYYNSKNNGMIYNDSQKLIDLFEPYFVGLAHEEFRAAYFDNKLALIKNVALDSGDTSSSSVNIRKLVEIALRENAATIAIAHNHPKTSSKPSTADINTTKEIIDVLRPMKIDFLDHIIVGEDSTISLREKTYIKFLGV
ncbi:MAG: hypothetical protein K2K44_13395, partial [Oscillospiraceae bacterium]|nr:hypothetical protein [Oscillospiraceae bacterium]